MLDSSAIIELLTILVHTRILDKELDMDVLVLLRHKFWRVVLQEFRFPNQFLHKCDISLLIQTEPVTGHLSLDLAVEIQH